MHPFLLYALPVLGLFIIMIAYVIKQNHTKAHLDDTSQRLFSLLSISQDAMMLLDGDNTVYFMNDAMSHLLHVENTRKILFDSDMPNIYYEGKLKRFEDFVQEEYVPMSDPKELSYYPQIQIKTRRQEKITVDLYFGKIYSPKKRSEQLVIVIRDLREALRQIASGELDSLTRLPSRTKAYQDYQILCSKHHLKQGRVALMTISIDDFLITQSLLGHEQADKTILAVTYVIKQLSSLHASHAYHLTYANFLLIFPEVDSIKDLFQTAHTIQSTISNLYEERKSGAYLTASIGIATTPESGAVTDLFKKAHEALIDARKYGIGNTHLSKETQINHSFNESTLQHDIQYAVERNELVIYYQPIIDARTNRVAAAEALMRWIHPELGLIPPLVFIPLMEKTGFIIEAGRFLVREVIHQQAKWKTFGFEPITVSLNASMREIENSEYVSYIIEQLKEYKVRPASIKVEITESLAVSNAEKMLNTLSQFQGTGVSLSLDDFGTGYTSFSCLTKIPASTLKIDKSFIDNLLEDEKSQQVVRAIIEVGHALDMDIVAEGVETAKVAQLLIEFGCDYLQGYYFSKPVPVFEMQGQLRPRKSLSEEQGTLKNSTPGDTLLLHDL